MVKNLKRSGLGRQGGLGWKPRYFTWAFNVGCTLSFFRSQVVGMLPFACVQWKSQLCGGADLMSGCMTRLLKVQVNVKDGLIWGLCCSKGISSGALFPWESCQAHQAQVLAKPQGVRAEGQPGQCPASHSGISGPEKHVALHDPEWRRWGPGVNICKMLFTVTKL